MDDRKENKDRMMVREEALRYGEEPKRQGQYRLEDYYAMPDDRRVELIDGGIYDMAAPTVLHQLISGQFYQQISDYINRKKGSCIVMYSPIDVRLDCDDRTMIQPDLMIVCDRDKIESWGIMGAPDFVLEVISVSTSRKDYTKKLQKYADAGVKEYWIMDPIRKILVTYDLAGESVPCISPLKGKIGMSLYHGELKIDLDEIAALVEQYKESV